MILFAMVSKLSSREKERKDKALIELPEVVNKIILLVNAGETIQQASICCVTKIKDYNSPLIKELTETVNKMVSNEPSSIDLWFLPGIIDMLGSTNILEGQVRNGRYYIDTEIDYSY